MMMPIQWALWAFLAAATVLWLLADTFFPQPFGYFAFRNAFMQYSGVVAMGAMSVGMVLATRPRWLEKWLDGLDKMYRLHKWLGITALAASVLHWWFAQGTKWMVGWGWLERPVRGGGGGGRGAGGGGPMPDAVVTLEDWFRTQRHLAESLGEWAFYVALILMVLALVRRFPYRWFARTHTVLAVAYLVLAFHAVVLLRYAYWSQPVGWLMALLTAAGVVSAVLVLWRHVAAGRKVPAVVVSMHHMPLLRVLRTTVRMTGHWPGHRAGQFAFVTADRAEGAHPYTMASAWDAGRREITFVTKALGDYTGLLHKTLQVGQGVMVEGPYGCFTFDDTAPRQIWVGGGIGITPFIARMQELALHTDGPPPAVDLFHTTADDDPQALALLQADAAAARIRLHVLVDRRDGLLSGQRIRDAVPEWAQASFWFCGPAAFGAALRADFARQGMNVRRHFHQELFAMR